MIREMRMKFFKSPLKLLFSLIVAVSLFLGDFVQLESYAAEEDLYVYFIETGFTYSDYAFKHFSSAPSFSSKYGVYDLYSEDGKYIGQKDIYVWVSNIKDETGNPYHFTDRPFVLTSDNKEPSAATRQASFYNMNYSFSKDLQNVNPFEFNFYPTSTGMSYSTPISWDYSNITLTVSSSGRDISDSPFVYVEYKLSADNWPIMDPGSYMLFFYSQFYDSMNIPSVLLDTLHSVPINIVSFNALQNCTAFSRSSRPGTFYYYFDYLGWSNPGDLSFMVAYYIDQSIPAFNFVSTANDYCRLFRADSLTAISVLNNTSQAQINAGNKNADDIMHSYDNTAGDAANGELSSILSGMEDAENKTWLASQESIGSYVFTDILNFSAGLMSGLSLIFSFANSFFLASGDLSVIVSVLYCMAFLAIILGLWRFFRGS